MQKYSNFGLKARSIMLQKNIKMTEIAENLKISVSYISDIFRGSRQGKKQKKRIMKFLEMDVMEES